ncbi:unnamed protein product [Discosporangium mesarthrocarpum]
MNFVCPPLPLSVASFCPFPCRFFLWVLLSDPPPHPSVSNTLMSSSMFAGCYFARLDSMQQSFHALLGIKDEAPGGHEPMTRSRKDCGDTGSGHHERPGTAEGDLSLASTSAGPPPLPHGVLQAIHQVLEDVHQSSSRVSVRPAMARLPCFWGRLLPSMKACQRQR